MSTESRIQKSVRLPAGLVEYVESQPGRDFSSKLVRLLEELRTGESEKVRRLARYDRLLEERRETLFRYADQVRKASLVLQETACVLSLAGEPGEACRSPDARP